MIEKINKMVDGLLYKKAYEKFEGSCLYLLAELIGKAEDPADISLRKIAGLKDLAGEMQSTDFRKKAGNIKSLIRWAGKKKKFKSVVESLKGKPGIKDPKRLTGWLKAQARKMGVYHKVQAVGNVKKMIAGLELLEDLEKGCPKKKKKIKRFDGRIR